MAADPPWRKGLLVTNAKGVYAVPIGEYVSGMVLRVHQPAAAWSADQAAHRWPAGEPPLIDPIRGKTAVIAGYGSIGREVARQLAALGMRIVAIKPHPDARADASYRVPGTGDPDGSIPERIVGDDGLLDAAREADVLVLTMPLTDASRGVIGREVLAALPATGLADQRLARRAGRRAGAARGAARRPSRRRRPRCLRRGAAAGRQPVVGRPERHRHAARVRPHVALLRRARRRERPALPGRRAAAQPGRPRARILGAGGGP